MHEADRPPDGEEITLTVPHDPRFVNVARIVVGGLAARLDLPFESLDDLQLAVEAVLSDERYVVGSDVTVSIVVRDGVLRVVIEPLATDAIEQDLERVEDDGLGLRVLLAAVVDSVGFEELPGRDRRLYLEKRVPHTVGS
jgi:anti-sigma regulatory factor (Ser/Thr protein kinase)